MRFSEAKQKCSGYFDYEQSGLINCQARLKKLAEELMAENEMLSGYVLIAINQKENRILAEETICLSGQSYIEEVLRTEKPDFPVFYSKA